MLTTDNSKAWMKNFANKIDEQKDELSRIDSIVGDGDHGNNMSRGMHEVIEQLEIQDPQNITEVFKVTAMSIMNKVGGASGALYGTAFLEMARASRESEELVHMLQSSVDKLQKRGKAKLGDKTMLDTWIPVTEAIKEDNLDLDTIHLAVDRTKEIRASKGRSSYIGDRSIGYPDLGALSSSYLFESLLETNGIL
ncbi:dihydroxyacetone kinase subunit L [Companilactobacillus sp. RD055328]|uniref:dihydroxyacetone kinase subunit DhaL n=1 Tax=Companilactobacillus sp. RD055328 TaxID=2916634 RepID=UPI001FC821DD|nr:dihydroxyacetone kinase subunit DhaL [Companilactobacillus sp. RD055328]GKQ42357.1 dihydroxyacetone kinase subunit L [Companilactobacillus sp. RD055328]